jgi:tetratricopeptide (TPR) repeat protein
VPESLCKFQWVNLFEEDGWTRLVKAIQEGMKRRAPVTQPAVQEATPSEPYLADEEPSPGTEMATPKEGPEQVQLPTSLSSNRRGHIFMETNFESVMQKGRKHLDAREWVEAAQCFEEALLLQPDSLEAEDGWNRTEQGRKAELAYNHGLSFIKKGRWEEGIAKLEEAEASSIEFPDLPATLKSARQQQEMESLHPKALEHEKAGQWAEAIPVLERLCELDENYEKAGERLAAARNERELQEMYEKAQTQIKRKNWGSALDIIRKIEQKRPDYPNIQSLKVEAENNIRWERWAREAANHEDDEDWKEAFVLYRKIWKENPEFPGLPERLEKARQQRDLRAAYEDAENYLKQEKWELARKRLDWVLEHAPDYEGAKVKHEIAQNALEGHKRLDEVDKHLEADQLAEARSALDEAIRLVPRDSLLHKRLVETQERLEEQERKRKQAIDNELRKADEAFTKGSLVEAQRILSNAQERYPKEKEIEDRLTRVEEALKHRRSTWGIAAAVIATLAGIVTILAFFGISIVRTGPTPTPTPTSTNTPTPTAVDTPTPTLAPTPTDTPTKVILSIDKIEVLMDNSPLDLDNLPRLTSGKTVVLEIVAVDSSGKRYASDDLVCRWSINPIGANDQDISTDLCKTFYTPSWEYSGQTVDVEVQGLEQQFESSYSISLKFDITS